MKKEKLKNYITLIIYLSLIIDIMDCQISYLRRIMTMLIDGKMKKKQESNLFLKKQVSLKIEMKMMLS